MATIWQALEHLDSLSAVASTWRGLAGEQFSLFQKSFLQPEPEPAFSISCPEHCGCAHEIVEHRNGRLVAVCRCDPWNCDDFTVTAADIVVWRLNQPKFRRDLSHAFGCEAMDADLGIRRTRQIGTFGHARVPVVLTILRDRPEFVSMARQLVGLLRERFILLAPTAGHLDGGTQAVLRNVNAAFFDLESNIEILPSGQLRARKPGAELFKAYLPEMRDAILESDKALVWRLFSELLAIGDGWKAPPARVFDLMVFKKKSKTQTASECDCAASLITKRVALIETHFSMPMERLIGYADDLQDRQRTVKGDRYATRENRSIHHPDQYADSAELDDGEESEADD